jgi:hypothetical protein
MLFVQSGSQIKHEKDLEVALPVLRYCRRKKKYKFVKHPMEALFYSPHASIKFRNFHTVYSI